MKRPSRRFLWTLFALLLVAAGLLGLWIRMQPEPPRRPVPDVWQRVDAASDGSLYLQVDGPPMGDWGEVGSGTLVIGRTSIPFIVIGLTGQARPSGLVQLVDRLTGDPMRSFQARHMYQAGAPVTTTLGTWQRYSANWAAGRTPPPPPPPPPAAK